MKQGMLAVGEAATMLGVSPDTVRRLADTGRLKSGRSPSGRRLIDPTGVARLMTETATPDLERRHRRSARNSFPGVVTRVVKDKVAAQVEIQAGPHRIVSLMTREAADELGLEPGVLAVAQVKSTNVVIELP